MPFVFDLNELSCVRQPRGSCFNQLYLVKFVNIRGNDKVFNTNKALWLDVRVPRPLSTSLSLKVIDYSTIRIYILYVVIVVV